MRWFRIRKASIPEADRTLFERFGAPAIQLVLFSDFSGPTFTEPKKTLYGSPPARDHAALWLTEEYDRADRKETWLITMEVAITVLVAVEVIFSFAEFVARRW